MEYTRPTFNFKAWLSRIQYLIDEASHDTSISPKYKTFLIELRKIVDAWSTETSLTNQLRFNCRILEFLADGEYYDPEFCFGRFGAMFNKFNSAMVANIEFAVTIGVDSENVRYVSNTNPDMETYYSNIYEFMQYYIADRDESHGLQHAKDVCAGSIAAYMEITGVSLDYSNPEHRVLVMSALLHDFADHKYTTSGSTASGCIVFGSNTPEQDLLKIMESWVRRNEREAPEVLKIIENISFSKEHAALLQSKIDPSSKAANDRMEEILSTEVQTAEVQTSAIRTLLIRNIISDVDKSLALGKPGFIRCLQYSSELVIRKFPELAKVSKIHKISHDIDKHYHDKIHILPRYFRTLIYQKKSKQLLKSFKAELTKFNNNPDRYLAEVGIQFPVALTDI